MHTDSKIWLRTRRVQLDQTQTEAADAVGVSRFTFARWEAGDGHPTLEHAVSLSRWAGCSLDAVASAFGFDLGGETVAEEADRLTDCSP